MFRCRSLQATLWSLVWRFEPRDEDDHLGQAMLQSADFHPDGFEGQAQADHKRCF